jgi:Zn-dependent metalloprotease
MPKKTTKAKTVGKLSSGYNGLSVFCLHANDLKCKQILSQLKQEHLASPSVAFALRTGSKESTTSAEMGPEALAMTYLQNALASDATPTFVAPLVDEVASEFKVIGTEFLPLTDTTMVKFRQTLNKIPVYGSLVSVELDEKNELLGIQAATGTPVGVDPVASISAARAVESVKDTSSDFVPNLKNVVPRLNYFFDVVTSKWYLAFILEDVPVTPNTANQERIALLKDFVIDANTGEPIATIDRTSTVAVTVTGTDCLGIVRSFQADVSGSKSLLKDALLNIQTFDLKGKDPETSKLPGLAIASPPAYSESAISAHANATSVSKYLRDVLKRNNIDGQGGAMNSSINCIVARESPDGLGKEWLNAYWNGKQMVYGLVLKNGKAISLAARLEVVAHEMTHGVTDKTSRLEYRFQSGALNESYSDIFGIIVGNSNETDRKKWNWEIGAGFLPSGKPFRNFAQPSAQGQPEHMLDLVNTQSDSGGVHTNSGIHNKAAYHLLMAKKSSSYAWEINEVAIVFYLALTQYLSRTSQFADSRRAVIQGARTFFRALPTKELEGKVGAIEKAFSAVGIE